MKKIFASIAVAFLAVGLSTTAFAQEEQAAPAADSTVVDSTTLAAPVEEEAPAVEEAVVEEPSFHQILKDKFLDGGADFMSLVAIALVLGLTISLERIIYLNLASSSPETLLKELEEKLEKNDIEGAKNLARNTRGPVASIAYQALMRADQGIDVVEKAVISYGGVQAGLLEKNLSWIGLFIAMAPSLGFLGTVVGMVLAFDTIEKAGDISPTVVAGGMKVALITTIGGLVVALILQIFYNYILSLIEGIINHMEDASISLLDMIIKRNVKFGK